MGFRIRKSIKVAPGVRLNFGKKGISTSIGKRGAGITIGPTGTTAHVGIPGTGISYVKKVGTTKKSVEEKSQSTGENKKPKRNFSCLGSFLAFSGIVIVMAIHSTCEWTALTLSILVICVLYISFAIITYLGNILKKNITTDTNHTKDVPQTKEPTTTPINPKDVSQTKESTITPINPKDVSQTMESTATPINPKEPFTRYKYPTINLLKKYEDNGSHIDEEKKANMNRIIKILGNFGIQIKTIRVSVGPAITLYEMQLTDSMLLSKVKEFEDDIAISLSAFGTRVITPIPGKETFGIEIPNSHPDVVGIESVLNSPQFKETQMELPLALGETFGREVFMVDLSKAPHLLIAGSVGQNGSLGLDVIIFSLLYKKHPNELKFVLIDLNKVELNLYSRIANKFMAAVPDEEPIVTNVKKAMLTLNSLSQVMNDRYKLFVKAGVCNIKEYNKMYVNHKLRLVDGHEFLPYIVVIINEFSDLIFTYGKEAEDLIASIAKKASAVGIHMVITTHHPTESIVTDAIKDNIPGRIAYRMNLESDSQIILGHQDANRLVGQGDMFCVKNNELVRVQCAFVDSAEIERVNEYISLQPGPIEPLELPEPPIEKDDRLSNATMDENCFDPFFEKAAYAIVISQNGSTALIQRRFAIGYNRASRLMDQLEATGIVGDAQGSKPREVLVQNMGELRLKLAKLGRLSYTSIDNNGSDPFFEEAAYAIVISQNGSTTLLQRRFAISYKRALRLMEQLETAGIVGEAQGSKPREVYVQSIGELRLRLAKFVKHSHSTIRQTTPANGLLSDKERTSGSQRIEADLQKIVFGNKSHRKEALPASNPLDALESLIGLTSVKEEVVSLVNFIKLNKKRAEQGLPVTQIAYHCVFTGNPGTGKTTVARLLAGIFKELGVLRNGQLIETDRSGLVAEYIGQTAVKTNKIIDSALDGVLFIDEAYTLAQGGSQDYGHEAIATLLKRMEDDRDRLIVILAGYGSEMKTFVESNPGLRSRFNRYINFPDYTPKELLEIFLKYLNKQQYVLSESALTQTTDFLTKEVGERKNDFGNARFVRNFFEKVITQQANRLANIENCDKDMLKRIEEEDIIKSIERI